MKRSPGPLRSSARLATITPRFDGYAERLFVNFTGVEIRAGDGRLEIEIPPTPMRLEKRGKGMVAVPQGKLPALSADEVRETLERLRR